MRAIALTLALSFLSAAAFAQTGGGNTPGFVVIVHPNNPATSVSRDFLADAFLKRVSRWPDDQVIRPVDQSDNAIRRRFVENVLDRTVAAIRSYWQQIIFTGRGVPPVELSSDAAVVAYVLRHRGAIGYVSVNAEIGRAKVVTLR